MKVDICELIQDWPVDQMDSGKLCRGSGNDVTYCVLGWIGHKLGIEDYYLNYPAISNRSGLSSKEQEDIFRINDDEISNARVNHRFTSFWGIDRQEREKVRRRIIERICSGEWKEG